MLNSHVLPGFEDIHRAVLGFVRDYLSGHTFGRGVGRDSFGGDDGYGLISIESIGYYKTGTTVMVKITVAEAIPRGRCQTLTFHGDLAEPHFFDRLGEHLLECVALART